MTEHDHWTIDVSSRFVETSRNVQRRERDFVHPHGTRYWLRGIAGPDGVLVLARHLSPPQSDSIGERCYALRHSYSEAEIIQAIRTGHAAEHASRGGVE